MFSSILGLDPLDANGSLIVYSKRCWICDLQEDLTSGPGTRLDHSGAFV